MLRLSFITLTLLLCTSANAKIQQPTQFSSQIDASNQTNGANVSYLNHSSDSEVQRHRHRHHHRRHRHHHRR
jgi:negative regulator of sigma E activity